MALCDLLQCREEALEQRPRPKVVDHDLVPAPCITSLYLRHVSPAYTCTMYHQLIPAPCITSLYLHHACTCTMLVPVPCLYLCHADTCAMCAHAYTCMLCCALRRCEWRADFVRERLLRSSRLGSATPSQASVKKPPAKKEI